MEISLKTYFWRFHRRHAQTPGGQPRRRRHPAINPTDWQSVFWLRLAWHRQPKARGIIRAIWSMSND